jgi:hypothetical protein
MGEERRPGFFFFLPALFFAAFFFVAFFAISFSFHCHVSTRLTTSFAARVEPNCSA